MEVSSTSINVASVTVSAIAQMFAFGFHAASAWSCAETVVAWVWSCTAVAVAMGSTQILAVRKPIHFLELRLALPIAGHFSIASLKQGTKACIPISPD